jgi:hypothetical protein
MFRIMIIVSTLLLLMLQNNVLAKQAVTLTDSIEISAGRLSLLEIREGTFAKVIVRLNNRNIYMKESVISLAIKKVFKSLSSGEDVVILEENSGGNGCPYSYIIIASKSNDRSFVSEPIGNCMSPNITREGLKVILRFPRDKSRASGDWHPAETWVFEKGRLNRLSQRSRGRR